MYNIGGASKTAISLIECIKLIEEIVGHKVEVKYDKDRFGDLRYFVCNIDKARKNLRWEPKTLPKKGITKLIDWIKENQGCFEVK